MVEGGAEELSTVKRIVTCFEAISGLQINREISIIYTINEAENDSVEVSDWKCKYGVLPDTYLGSPLGVGYKSKEFWDSLIDRFNQRLAAWKRRLLSKGGMLVLIQSTLASIPVYLFSILTIPIGVAAEIEKLIKRFLWGTNKNTPKAQLIAWKEICMPKEWGGLGLRHISDFNHCLLAKWLWRFTRETDKLWRQVTADKFELDKFGWFTKVSKGSMGCSVWRGIMRCKDLFVSNITFKLGRGDRIRFWEDAWNEQFTLRDLFPIVFENSRTKDTAVHDCCSINGSELQWSLGLRRRLSLEEQRESKVLLYYLKSVTLHERDDELLWLSKDHPYTVKSCALSISTARASLLNLGPSSFEYARIWNPNTPIKVSFMLWLMIKNRLVVEDRVKTLGISIASVCAFCNSAAEGINHAFLTCPFADRVWDYFFVASQIAKPISITVEAWPEAKTNRMGRFLWQRLPNMVLWALWLERNGRKFDDIENVDRVINNIKSLLWAWSLGDCRFKKLRLEDLIFDWSTIMKP